MLHRVSDRSQVVVYHKALRQSLDIFGYDDLFRSFGVCGHDAE